MGEYSIGDAMKKFLESSRLKGSVQAIQVGEAWEEIMGKTIAKYTESIKIIDKTLIIVTNVAPLKQELIYQKAQIIQRVNEAMGANTISEVVIK